MPRTLSTTGGRLGLSRLRAVAIHRQSFFEIMASFPTGVAIVTTLDAQGAPRGLTTTAVSSVSAHPPTVLVCVDLGRLTLYPSAVILACI